MKKTLLAVMALVSLCSYGQLANEGFETPWVSSSPNSPAAPPGWTVINEYGPNVTWVHSFGNTPDQPPFVGNGAAFLNRENAAPSANIPKDWLISPSFVAPFNGQIQFQSRLTIAGDQGGTYSVLISTDSDPANLDSYMALYTATELQINPEQTSYNQVTVDLAQFGGQQVHIAFVMEGDNADRWLIDDVGITTVCNNPVNLSASTVSSTSVALGWNSNAASYEVEVTPATAAPTGAGAIYNGPAPYIVEGLLPDTEYRFYVRAICQDGSHSNWVGPLYFTTSLGQTIVNGIVKFDSNGDEVCDASDNGLGLAEVKLSINGVSAYSVYTNSDGEYSISGLPSGTSEVSLQVVTPVGFAEVPPVVQTVVNDGETENPLIEHCLPQPEDVNDLGVTLVPITVVRPGLPAKYSAFIRNYGNTTLSGVSLNVTFDTTKITYTSSTFSGAVATGNTIAIALGDIEPFQLLSGNIEFTVMIPPVVVGGETLLLEAELSEIENDATPQNNQAVLNQVIVNSYDPNDITVHEGAKIYEEQADDYLTYTIRFQNMGTAEAIDIEVENTLDPLLDWDTFEPIASSHNYVVKRTDDKLEFVYKGINLPHEDADEPGSHGFVTYKIKPKAEYGLGDIVSNTAEIYFDFNEAIVTNTATTEVIELLSIGDKQIAVARLYPNPVKDQLHVAVVLGQLQSVVVTDVNGRQCLSSNAETIDTNSLGSGVYFVKVTTDAGSADYKIIKH